MKKLILIPLVLILTACSSGPEKQRVSGKFVTMKQCLDTIYYRTNEELKLLVDSSETVSGKLGDTKLNFYCGVKKTGSEGIYIEGWYESLVK